MFYPSANQDVFDEVFNAEADVNANTTRIHDPSPDWLSKPFRFEQVDLNVELGIFSDPKKGRKLICPSISEDSLL